MCFIKTYFNNAKSIFISKFNYNFKLCNVQTATITVRTQLEKLHTLEVVHSKDEILVLCKIGPNPASFLFILVLFA